MGYLYMGVVLTSWTALAFAYRWAESRRANRLFMATAMGLAGVFWTLLWAFAQEIDPRGAHVSQVIIGSCVGAMTVFGIPIFMAAVARGDLSITWTLLTLSFALASLMVMVYPGEQPTAAGAAGLVVAAVAVVLLGLDMAARHRSEGPGKPRKGWWLFISISFFTNAIALYGYSLAAEFQPDKTMVHRLTFLLSMYAVFAAGSLPLAFLIRRRGSVKTGLAAGSVAGTLLLAGGFFTLSALSEAGVPGYVLYPATSGGSAVLVVVLSVLFLRERPGRFGWMGIAAGTAALVLLGLAA